MTSLGRPEQHIPRTIVESTIVDGASIIGTHHLGASKGLPTNHRRTWRNEAITELGEQMPPQGLTQQQLESRLWAAANSLRGPVDPADFKSYVFPLLFLKWVSDTWDLEHADALADFGDNISAEEEADYHRFVVPIGCDWSDLRSVSVNVGVTLQNILQRLEEANPQSLAGIFGDVTWANKERLPEPSLLNLIDAFDRLTLNRDVVSNDMLGAAYEYLLRQFVDESGKKAGEFFTPRAIVKLLVHVLSPQPGDAVYDPACGSGGMLVETINEVRESGVSIQVFGWADLVAV